MDKEEPITKEEIVLARQVKEAVKASQPGVISIPDETVALILRAVRTAREADPEGDTRGDDL